MSDKKLANDGAAWTLGESMASGGRETAPTEGPPGEAIFGMYPLSTLPAFHCQQVSGSIFK